MRVREAEVPIVSEGECVRQINAVTEKIFIMPASSFGAGGEAGNDACQVINIHMNLRICNSLTKRLYVATVRVTAEVLWCARTKAITN